MSSAESAPNINPNPAHARRSLWGASTAHAVHDGLTDLIYLLLPFWQAQFGLTLTQVGLLRGAYAGVMASMQLVAGKVSRRVGRVPLLIGGTALVGLAYCLAGASGGIVMLLVALMLGGLGASVQHPLASSLVADSHPPGAPVKHALAQYNFAGDMGKMLLPALVGLMLTQLSWRAGAWLAGGLGLAAAVLLWWCLPRQGANVEKAKLSQDTGKVALPAGMYPLLGTGVIDSAVRMGFMTFLPFLLLEKGAGSGGIGLALALLFAGGAFGKLACGYLGARFGLKRTVWLTEGGTALCIAAAVWLPLAWLWWLLPVLGVMLNGTSSVLYGALTELAAPGAARERAFAWQYTAVIGSGALAPLLFGGVADGSGVAYALLALSAILLFTLPLAWQVQRVLDRNAQAAQHALQG